ncbi:sigma-54-dependent transcriptional regulator [Mesobacterium pallidum]|uniref:sigma-54-dependent transcriptional regulator n=1 Tax=Mesobacterium pallidum TaxID=2872037 RepID=UPI001EE27661|nr:sigma-54 dependent transcriptional regulator [Mesobacterium pallidum]
MSDPIRVLVVDDDRPVREALAQTLELADFDPLPVSSFIEAKDHIAPDFAGVVLSDIRMPGRDGFHLLAHAQGIDSDLPVILLTGEGDIPMAVRAMGQGAFGFLEKPCAPEELTAVIERALRTRAMVLENRRLKAEAETGDAAARMIFGHSSLSEELRDRVRAAARLAEPVLVTGAPGTGISKVAEVVHLSSALAKRAFVKRAGAGLSRTDLAAALGEARGGTLYIDEVAAMPRDSQLALVDHLDGANEARVIGGAAGDLSAGLTDDRFYPELYYRLSTVAIRIPSLAERPEDIPILFRKYVAQASEQAGLRPPEITPDLIAALMAQDWPGNARSLMSAAMRFVLGMPEEITRARDLGLTEQMAQVERSILVAALGRANGRASEAAQALKLPRKTFYDKLSKYGIKPETYRRDGA